MRVLGQYTYMLLVEFYMFRSYCFSFSIHFPGGSREVENDIMYTKRITSNISAFRKIFWNQMIPRSCKRVYNTKVSTSFGLTRRYYKGTRYWRITDLSMEIQNALERPQPVFNAYTRVSRLHRNVKNSPRNLIERRVFFFLFLTPFFYLPRLSCSSTQ